MSDASSTLKQRLLEKLPAIISAEDAFDQVTIELPTVDFIQNCILLRDHPDLRFEQLTDVCGIDYLSYGDVEWETVSATGTGFSRGVNRAETVSAGASNTDRFAVVYHLISVSHNKRLRVRVRVATDAPIVDSVVDIWSGANWYEREAFDLYGIMFRGHPDLRRILTDYGFIGHPFRKDFPLIGNVEMRYDTEKQRVVYEPVSIEPRTLVPKVKRDDNRYVSSVTEGE
ncbi:MAG: NADH-quinone oxidoreductase subunit C [Gammaproteobacteria bacterium]|nr:NADH-quinone oxidoreductase subunit C [Gammaproteobacteria bacterium]MDH5800473.1 NADH-quinone oxidoreductase subunit C [Gammaproteobacteria bacterium]